MQSIIQQKIIKSDFAYVSTTDQHTYLNLVQLIWE